MSPAAKLLSQFVRQTAHIRAFCAGNTKTSVRFFVSGETKTVNSDESGFTLHFYAFARQFIKGDPFDLDCRDHEISNDLKRFAFELFSQITNDDGGLEGDQHTSGWSNKLLSLLFAL